MYTLLKKHYHHRYRLPYKHHGPTMLMIDLTLASLAAMVLVGGIFAFYLLPVATPWAGFNLAIAGPTAVTVGAPTRLVVTWSNDTGRELKCGTLRLSLPDGVKAEGQPDGGSTDAGSSCLPTDLEPLAGEVRVPIGDLKASSRGTVRLPVRFYGTGERPVTVSSDLLYWDMGKAAVTRAAASRSWLTGQSVLKLKATWPSNAVLGRETALTVDCENDGGETLNNLTLKIDAPEGFRITGTVPYRQADGTIRLQKIGPGERGQAVVHGLFTKKGVAAAVTVTAGLADGEVTHPLAAVRTNADPRAADLQLAAEVVAPSGVTGLEPGSQVHYVLRYANTGRQNIDHASFWVETNALKGLVADLDQQRWKWDESAFPQLASISPDSSGELTGSFQLSPEATDKAAKIALEASGRYLLPDDAVRPVLVSAAPLEFTLTAATRLTARAAYYTPDGDQLGVGPLPPRVGETTQYWIFLKPEAIGKRVEDAVITLRLPVDVAWTGRTSATAGLAPSFDPSTRRVTWRAGSLDPSTQAVAGFEISLTPTVAQAGTVPTLVTDIRLSARDAESGYALDKSATALTTDLAGDELAAGKGTVAKEPAAAKKKR